MKKLYAVLFFCSILSISYAQQEETIFNEFGGIDFTGVWAGSNNSLTDFDNDFEVTNGGFVVFEFNNNFLIGWEGYDSGFTSDGTEIDIKGNDLLLGYAWRSKKVIHPIMYLKGGKSTLEVNDVSSDKVFVVQPTIGAEVNIARFFRLGLDGGYRFFGNTDLNGFSNNDFSGPIMSLRLKFGWSWGR